MDIIHQYPPELFQLLVDTVPKVCKAKKDVLQFFRGAGVDRSILKPYEILLTNNSDGFNKYPVTREIIGKLNDLGERTLRERREILKRVVEFADFSVCWPTDQAPARGLVAQVRELVNVKDAFTRINQERESERSARLAESKRQTVELQRKKDAWNQIRTDLFALVASDNPHQRGKKLESILNRFFKERGVLIREAFAIRGDNGEGIIGQIDGVIEVDGDVYLVEMKWWKEPLGPRDVAQHQVRVYHRGQVQGIFISYSPYTDAAILSCKESLQKAVFVLCNIQEIVKLLDREANLKEWLKAKINAAKIHKNPLFDPLG
ncbi:MAG TPA: restriction endonuclease [Candidatus Paceibacterota bacterium]|nr:restriction endonuclease [Candidatus Paceibacterota bacterium]